MPILTDDDGNEYDIPDHLLAPGSDADKPKNFRRALEADLEAARKGKTESDARADAAERQLAFAKAGVPLTDPRASYFVAGYQGELTDDAIKAEAATFGFGTAAPAVPSDATAALNTIGQANDGAAAPGARNFAAEMKATELLPPEEGMAKLRELAREQGVQVLGAP